MISMGIKYTISNWFSIIWRANQIWVSSREIYMVQHYTTLCTLPSSSLSNSSSITKQPSWDGAYLATDTMHCLLAWTMYVAAIEEVVASEGVGAVAEVNVVDGGVMMPETSGSDHWPKRFFSIFLNLFSNLRRVF